MTKNKIYIVLVSFTLLMVLSLYLNIKIQQVQSDITVAERNKFESVKLANEMRRSSDDLTMLARAYTITQNKDFLKYFNQILDIRDGELERPKLYSEIYWDFVIVNQLSDTTSGRKISFEQLMIDLGFSEKEFDLLSESKYYSDSLAVIEKIAMEETDPLKSALYLHSDKYFRLKAKIMDPINEFIKHVDERTTESINVLQNEASSYITASIVVISLIILFIVTFTVSFFLQFSDVKLKNLRMSEELNVAKDIQMSMLPLIFPAFPNRKEVDIYADLIPAREVGGDFYDFFFIDDNNLCFVVGDVSGKGVPAALMMAVCKTLLKSNSSGKTSTAEILTKVNEEMANENKNLMFVTVFMAILNTTTGELTYTNAGHNHTYVKRADGTTEKLKTLHGPAAAVMKNIAYSESKIVLNKDDIVFAYTDGIPEAHNKDGELFSDQRLELFIERGSFKSADAMVEGIIKEVSNFEQDREKFDDLTALCVKFNGNK